MSWNKLLLNAAAFLLSLVMSFIAWQSSRVVSTMETLSSNVAALNVQMQVIVNEVSTAKERYQSVEQKNADQDKILFEHEARIRVMEKRP